MVAPALSFHTLHPFYVKNYWLKRREPSILDKIDRWLPKIHLLANQHERIMSGELLRGVRKRIEVTVKPKPALTSREAKALSHIAAGAILDRMTNRLVVGNRTIRIRQKAIDGLIAKGRIAWKGEAWVAV